MNIEKICKQKNQRIQKEREELSGPPGGAQVQGDLLPTLRSQQEESAPAAPWLMVLFCLLKPGEKKIGECGHGAGKRQLQPLLSSCKSTCWVPEGREDSTKELMAHAPKDQLQGEGTEHQETMHYTARIM